MNKKSNISLLFVCTGHICRSPVAEGVFREALKRSSRENFVQTDSAGTHYFHAGVPTTTLIDYLGAHGVKVRYLRSG